MAKINVTLRDDVLAELDVLVERSALGSRSAVIAGLVREAHTTVLRQSSLPQPLSPVVARLTPSPHSGAFSKQAQAGKAKR